MKFFAKTLTALLICGSLGIGLTADRAEASEIELTPNMPETQELKRHPYDPPPGPRGPHYGPPPGSREPHYGPPPDPRGPHYGPPPGPREPHYGPPPGSRGPHYGPPPRR